MKIISETNVYSWTHCGTSCLRKRFCVAYNYKENAKGNEMNCQLTATTRHHFEKGREGDDGWSFYVGFGEKKVRILTTIVFCDFVLVLFTIF